MKSILHDRSEGCWVCGSPYVEEHHIFGGANRKNSEKYGLKIYLCHRHHNEPSTGVHFVPEFRAEIQKMGQEAYELVYGDNFKEVFGKDYK